MAEMKITDEQYIAEWRSLLGIFHSIEMGKPESEKKYNELKELAKNSSCLTPRQREGLVDRCNNCLNGTYGKTKKAEHLDQSHNFSNNGKQQ